MPHTAFIQQLVATHLSRKAGEAPPPDDLFSDLEERWLGIYGVGKLELYTYLYTECTGVDDFRQWLLGLKGPDAVAAAHTVFDQWAQRKAGGSPAAGAALPPSMLDAAQLAHWQEQGFLRIGGLVPLAHCDAVKAFICDYQGISPADPATWYPGHADWHGLMLQVYQHPSIAAIRQLPALEQLFAGLYQTRDIVPNTDKVSYNPPETGTWKFRHHHLHWDMDLTRPPAFYIQGLVYLDDVPEDRGPLKLIPGFQHRFAEYIRQFPDPAVEAQAAIRHHAGAIPVPGNKGDVVLWLQTLPHAASANHSDRPRFVQYVSFTKL